MNSENWGWCNDPRSANHDSPVTHSTINPIDQPGIPNSLANLNDWSIM